MPLTNDQIRDIQDMMNHPGWQWILVDLEETLHRYVLTMLVSLDHRSPNYSVEVAYWKGQIEALWSVFTWINQIMMMEKEGEEKGVEMDGGVMKWIIAKVLRKKVEVQNG